MRLSATVLQTKCYFYLSLLVIAYLVALSYFFLQQRSKRFAQEKIDSTIISGVTVQELINLANNFVSKDVDYEKRARNFAGEFRSYSGHRENKLLCATFIKLHKPALDNVIENVKQTFQYCDWLIIVYQYDPSDRSQLINTFNEKLHNYSTIRNIPHNNTVKVFFTFPNKRNQIMDTIYHTWKLYESNLFRGNQTNSKHFLNAYQFIGLTDQSNISSLTMFQLGNNRYNGKIFPKSILFLSILPHLKHYKNLWMLDGDISLRDFDMTHFLKIKECSFEPFRKPLVVQSLVAENSQTYKYLNADTWKDKKRVLAAYSGFIEIQAPMVDTAFFEWFVVSFVVPMILPSHVLGADWGFDELFCKAADFFALHSNASFTQKVSELTGNSDSNNRMRSNQDAGRLTSACAVIVSGTPIHHANKKEMNSILGYDVKKRLNKELMRIIGSSFPNFIRSGKGIDSDPLFPGSRFEFLYKINKLCKN